jgi:hypothetical protein
MGKTPLEFFIRDEAHGFVAFDPFGSGLIVPAVRERLSLFVHDAHEGIFRTNPVQA